MKNFNFTVSNTLDDSTVDPGSTIKVKPNQVVKLKVEPIDKTDSVPAYRGSYNSNQSASEYRFDESTGLITMKMTEKATSQVIIYSNSAQYDSFEINFDAIPEEEHVISKKIPVKSIEFDFKKVTTVEGAIVPVEVTILPENATNQSFTIDVMTDRGSEIVDVRGYELHANTFGFGKVIYTARDGSGVRGSYEFDIKRGSASLLTTNQYTKE